MDAMSETPVTVRQLAEIFQGLPVDIRQHVMGRMHDVLTPAEPETEKPEKPRPRNGIDTMRARRVAKEIMKVADVYHSGEVSVVDKGMGLPHGWGIELVTHRVMVAPWMLLPRVIPLTYIDEDETAKLQGDELIKYVYHQIVEHLNKSQSRGHKHENNKRWAFTVCIHLWWLRHGDKTDKHTCAGCLKEITKDDISYPLVTGEELHDDYQCADKYSKRWIKTARKEVSSILGVNLP